MLKWEIICPQERAVRCSVSVSRTAFRLLLHILMLSKAGMGLAVLVYSMGLIIPSRGNLGYDDTD